MDEKEKLLKTLKPFNAVIQTCPVCGKIDVWLNDNHRCEEEVARQINNSFNK